MRLAYRKEHSRHDEENPYWISFSDIMAGLLVIFILASVALIIKLASMQEEAEKAIKEIQQVNQLRAEMLREVKDKLAAKGIMVEISENMSVLRIPDDQLYFDTLRHDIPETKKGLVSEIGSVLYTAIVKDNRFRYIDTIFIEGHTDSRPANQLSMGNWGLSTYRAIAIWKFWSEEQPYGQYLKELKNSYGIPMFSVSGYAATRRVEEVEDTKEKLRSNRRIDLRFAMKKPVIADYEGVISLIESENEN